MFSIFTLWKRTTLEKEIDLRKKIQSFDENHQGVDINNLIKEVNEYKELYKSEICKTLSLKSTVESQKKMLASSQSKHNLYKIKNNSAIGFYNTKTSNSKFQI